jgi:IS30 family transposase
MSFKAIGKRVGKDQTTISKEVKKHVVVRPCNMRKVDEEGSVIANKPCPRLLQAPFICNPCPKYHGSCGYDHQVYVAAKAQAAYKQTLHDSREGVATNKEAFWQANEIISRGVKNGQHLYHILASHSLAMSKSSAYRHLKQGRLDVSLLDFPRVVKFKPRAQRKPPRIPKAIKKGRILEDFLIYTKEKTFVNGWRWILLLAVSVVKQS